MKRKIFAAISVTLFLVATLFIVFPAKSQFVGTIKIGAIGPMPWIQGKGIAEGVKLAAKQINDAGGVVTTETWGGGVPGAYRIEVVTADTLRGQPDPTPATGTAAAMELTAAGCDYIIGGFRTESVYGIREVVAASALSSDDKPIFIIAGAATNDLIDEADTVTYPATVRSDYNRYRFIFRATPMNSTMLFVGIAFYLQYLMAAKVAPIITGYANPLPIAVISEDLTWTQVMHYVLGTLGDIFWNGNLPGYGFINVTGGVDVVYTGLVGPTATDVSSELQAAELAGARVIIEILSGPVGRTMAIQYADLGIGAVLTGIDVPAAEIPLHWEATAGKCEYESALSTTGKRTPVTTVATAFWDAYVAEYGHAPIYTSYGAYDAVRGIRETIEAVGKWPMGAKEIVPYQEQTLRLRADLPGGTGMMSTFKYTGPNPSLTDPIYDGIMANGTHSYLDINPTKMGTLHELYDEIQDYTQNWYYPYYGRSLCTQWQTDPLTGEGTVEVFYPMNQPWSTRFLIPEILYEAANYDLFGAANMPDGLVDVYDLGTVATSWLSVPGDLGWVAGGAYFGLNADQDNNKFINVADLSAMAKWYGYNASLPANYGQWPLG